MIDFSFISDLEGKSLVGYVPKTEGMKSGVTIACGFDIGQRNYYDLNGLPAKIKVKLSPYIDATGQEAVGILESLPLEITEEECAIINQFAHKEATNLLVSRWNKESFTTFSMIPDESQTVLASVAFQYGSLEKATPNFWRQTTSGDWTGALANLRNFGDAFKTRRNKEADLLESRLNETLV